MPETLPHAVGRMVGRDPQEVGPTSTPLELLLDLASRTRSPRTMSPTASWASCSVVGYETVGHRHNSAAPADPEGGRTA
jgi:hypothetical protein